MCLPAPSLRPLLSPTAQLPAAVKQVCWEVRCSHPGGAYREVPGGILDLPTLKTKCSLQRKGSLSHSVGRTVDLERPVANGLEVPHKPQLGPPCDPARPPLGVCRKKWNQHHRHACTPTSSCQHHSQWPGHRSSPPAHQWVDSHVAHTHNRMSATIRTSLDLGRG